METAHKILVKAVRIGLPGIENFSVDRGDDGVAGAN